jgi:hypothetical protein
MHMHAVPSIPSRQSVHEIPSPLVTCAPLADGDSRAAEALVAAMVGWEAAELAAYREAVLAEVAALGNRPPHGFLAAEIAALSAVDAGR